MSAPLHWHTPPKAWKCRYGHPYVHPKESNWSLFFGGDSVLLVFVVCQHCKPYTFQMGAVYNVKPLPITFWYSLANQQEFDRVRQMDEDGLGIDAILTYIQSHEETAA